MITPIRACLAGHRVAFATATATARIARLKDELKRLGRVPLLIVDEVGYIPLDPEAANLMFTLVSRRYERASLIVTSNKAFSAWGDSHRLRDKDLEPGIPALDGAAD